MQLTHSLESQGLRIQALTQCGSDQAQVTQLQSSGCSLEETFTQRPCQTWLQCCHWSTAIGWLCHCSPRTQLKSLSNATSSFTWGPSYWFSLGLGLVQDGGSHHIYTRAVPLQAVFSHPESLDPKDAPFSFPGKTFNVSIRHNDAHPRRRHHSV